MIVEAGDLGIWNDFGFNIPGSVLQKYDSGQWETFLLDGKPVTDLDPDELPPGRYRLAKSPISGQGWLTCASGLSKTALRVAIHANYEVVKRL
jgi:hypothetical protein